VSYDGEQQRWYAAFWDAGVTVDVVDADADLSAYSVVVVPCLYTVTDAQAASIAAAAQAGAQVVVTYFSGIVDEHEHIRLGGYPGAFRDLLGVRVEEFFPLPDGATVHLDDGSTGSTWTEMLHLQGAKAVASYGDGPVSGVPAITRNDVGEGAAWYVATALDPAGAARVVEAVCQAADLGPLLTLPPGVEVIRRSAEDRSYLFVLNHTADPVEVPTSGFDLRHNQVVDGTTVVSPGGVSVIRESV
jgi:beta-galactosidase